MFARLVRWLRWLVLALVLAVAGVQLWFLGHILYWVENNPTTTRFMALRLEVLRAKNPKVQLARQWVAYRDISLHLKRAIIVAEDTRHSRKLLTHFDIPAAGRLVAGHEHNEAARADTVALDCRDRRGLQRRVLGHSKVVVAGERQKLPPVALGPDALRPLGRDERAAERVALQCGELV